MNINTTRIAGKIFSSRIFVLYQAYIALMSKSQVRREKASIILQAIILKSEPRVPIRLLKSLHERVLSADKTSIKYILDEFQQMDYEGRTSYQIDFPWEMEYIVSLMRRSSELWNVRLLSYETFRDPQE